MAIFRGWYFLVFALALAADDLPAAPVTVTSLELGKVKQEYGSPQVDLAVEKHPLTVNRRAFPHGLGTHADSYLAIKLDKGSTRFTASVGVDDEAGDAVARVKFLVYGDGKILWQSKDGTYHQDALPVDVDVTGIDVLILAVSQRATGFHQPSWRRCADPGLYDGILSGSFLPQRLPYF